MTSRHTAPEQSSLNKGDYSEGEQVRLGSQKEYQRQYYLDNREQLLEYARIRYNAKRDEKAAYYISRKEAQRIYQADNRESINAQRRERYHRNKQWPNGLERN